MNPKIQICKSCEHYRIDIVPHDKGIGREEMHRCEISSDSMWYSTFRYLRHNGEALEGSFHGSSTRPKPVLWSDYGIPYKCPFILEQKLSNEK